MKAADLIVGATYLVHSLDSKGGPWKGEAVYIGLDTSGSYPPDTHEFTCVDDGMPGMFDPDEIIMLVKSAPLNDRAERIVKAILNNLSGRKGVGDELDQIDEDIQVEMRAELVALVERELKA